MRRHSFSAIAVAVVIAACGSNGAAPSNSIHGTVTLNGATTGDSGVLVSVGGTSQIATTDDGGSYKITAVAAGSYTITAQKAGYAPGSAMVMVTDGATAEAPPINLVPAASGQGNVAGRAVLFDATQHDGTQVALMPGMLTATTDAMGTYMFSNVPAGTYDAVFTHAGYTSQTVHNIIVSSGTFTMNQVTLRRTATIAGGHTIVSFGPAPNGQSSDLSKVLVSIDGSIFVVPEATGNPVNVSKGTNASGASFSRDGNRVSMTYSQFAFPTPPTVLWVGPADGSALPRLLTTNLDSNFAVAVFSYDSSHIWFDTTRAPSPIADPNALNGLGDVGDWYIASTGAPTKVISNGRLMQVTSGLRQALFATNRKIVQATVVEDLVLLDPNTATVTTLATQIVASELDAAIIDHGFFARDPLVLTSVTGLVGGITVGDLYQWRPGDATATMLTSTPIDSNASIDTTTSTGHVFVTATNQADTTTLALYAFDTIATPTLRTLVPASRSANNVLFDPGESFLYANNTKQLSLSKNAVNGATIDLYNVDITNATSAKIGTSVTHFGDPASSLAGPITNFTRPLDPTHVLFATAANGTTFTMQIWDGTYAHQVQTAVPKAAVGLVQLSTDGLTAAYFAPGVAGLPLTSAIIPAVAGNAVIHTLPITTPATPTVFSLSRDGLSVAYATMAATPSISTTKTDGTAAAVQATTGQAGRPVTWMLYGVNKDAILYGDNAPAVVNNAFVVAPAAASAPRALGNLGAASPRLFPLADGKRVFLVDANATTSALDLPAGTALTTLGTTTIGGSAVMNPAATRFFFDATPVGGTTSGLLAAGTTGSTLAGPTAGTWVVAIFSPDKKSTVFADISGGFNAPFALAAYAETGAIIPLATAADFFANGITALPNGNLAWIDQVSATSRQLCAMSLNTPARNVVVSGMQTVGFGATFGTAPGNTPWLSPNGKAMYAWGNVGTTTPSFTLAGFVFATATIGTIGTNVIVGQSNAASSVQYDPTLSNMVFASSFDSLAGSFTLSSVTAGTAAAGTQIVQGALSWRFSAFSGVKVGGAALVGNQPSLFAGTLGVGGGVIGPIKSTNPQIFFSGDESHIFAEDPGTGASYYATLGASALTQFDDGVIADGLFPDIAGTSCIEIAQHPGSPDVIVGRVTAP